MWRLNGGGKLRLNFGGKSGERTVRELRGEERYGQGCVCELEGF
jgi:hypothetical protein